MITVPPRRFEERVNPEQLESDVRHVEHLIEEMVRATKALPPVDEQGVSECPFAEDLYAQNERRVAELQEKVLGLRNKLPSLDREIQRWCTNIGVVAAGHGKLHGDQAKDDFAQASGTLNLQYDRFMELRNRVVMVIQEARAAIGQAMLKQYPGKIPDQRPPIAPPGVSAPDMVPPPVASPVHPAPSPPLQAPAAPPGSPQSGPAVQPVPPHFLRQERDDLYALDHDRASTSDGEQASDTEDAPTDSHD